MNSVQEFKSWTWLNPLESLHAIPSQQYFPSGEYVVGHIVQQIKISFDFLLIWVPSSNFLSTGYIVLGQLQFFMIKALLQELTVIHTQQIAVQQ